MDLHQHKKKHQYSHLNVILTWDRSYNNRSYPVFELIYRVQTFEWTLAYWLHTEDRQMSLLSTDVISAAVKMPQGSSRGVIIIIITTHRTVVCEVPNNKK